MEVFWWLEGVSPYFEEEQAPQAWQLSLLPPHPAQSQVYDVLALYTAVSTMASCWALRSLCPITSLSLCHCRLDLRWRVAASGP
jgi:hypothetical protein